MLRLLEEVLQSAAKEKLSSSQWRRLPRTLMAKTLTDFKALLEAGQLVFLMTGFRLKVVKLSRKPWKKRKTKYFISLHEEDPGLNGHSWF